MPSSRFHCADSSVRALLLDPGLVVETMPVTADLLLAQGGEVYITWNGNRGTNREDLQGRIRFNTCAMTVVHVPESERRP